jgi:NarL family two-component system response regulator LiaR
MTERDSIRVMIVDDHPIVRDGLASMLAAADDMELCAEASSGRQALDLYRTCRPDVILMDMVMPGMDGPTTIEKLLDRHPDAKIVALTSFPEEELIHRAMRAGAIGYLLKNAGTETLTNAIRAAHSGHATLAPEAAQALTRPTAGSSGVGYDLTERERETLALIVQGLSNEQIAERLVVSLATVKHHVSACISKLGATNRAQAAALAVQYGLVPKSE